MAIRLVEEAIEQSRERGPEVRAMVLLRGARVLAAGDEAAARAAYAEGLALAEQLPLEPRTMLNVLNEAVLLGIDADPEGALALFRRVPVPSERWGWKIGAQVAQKLAQRGNLDAALEVLEDPNLGDGGALNIIHLAKEPALQRRVMAAALERWRRLAHEEERFADHEFLHLFAIYWQKLEPTDQLVWLSEVVDAIESAPDHPTDTLFGRDVHFTSQKDARLFMVLGVLVALRPAEEVAALLARYPNVEQAARNYPLGMQSMFRTAPADAPAASGGGVGFAMGGDPATFDIMRAAHRGEPSAVNDMMGEALRLFRIDQDAETPNYAPVFFWPSCSAYQTALYWAGKIFGESGAQRLEEVPDLDLALFARISFAASLLGLAEHGNTRMFQPGRSPWRHRPPFKHSQGSAG